MRMLKRLAALVVLCAAGWVTWITLNANVALASSDVNSQFARQDGFSAPSFGGAIEWINSTPLSFPALRGKVVLVNFWTYSCINSLRALPYLREWDQKYRDKGLVVIGVHTPEFSFEHDPANVRLATRQLPVSYPVAVDSHGLVWGSFGNEAWPAFYIVDARGRIADRVYGEGSYAQIERRLQALLREAGGKDVPTGLAMPVGSGTQAAPSDQTALSPETYVGTDKAERFVSPIGLATGVSKVYPLAPRLRLNEWSLSGAWRDEGEAATTQASGARLSFRFKARDLHLVMGPSTSAPVRFTVSIDGKPPGANHGTDVDEQGRGVVDGHRLFQLVRQQGPNAEHLFEIEFLGALALKPLEGSS